MAAKRFLVQLLNKSNIIIDYKYIIGLSPEDVEITILSRLTELDLHGVDKIVIYEELKTVQIGVMSGD